MCNLANSTSKMQAPMQVKDVYNREFKTLRVSLTDVCNLGCIYCLPDVITKSGSASVTQAASETQAAFPKVKRPVKGNLPASELLQLIIKLHSLLELKTVRLTGGEPLLSFQLPALLTGIKEAGISDIRITTNGYLLEEKAVMLKAGGISSVNISLDAVEQAVFEKISGRKNLDKIIRGIDLCLSLGLPVKLNAVIMKGVNEGQLLPLFEFARSRKISIRFLELMKMGHLHGDEPAPIFTEAEMLAVISSGYTITELPRKASATARNWQTEDGFVFGIIANESSPFCSDCDRLRIDSAGNMYGCLSSNIPVKLSLDDSEPAWIEKLGLALSHKQSLRFTGSELSMIEIGG